MLKLKYDSFKQAMDEHFSHVKFDDRLAREIMKFQTSFVTRSAEHLEFFSGNLLGVNTLRFTDNLIDQFFDIFEVDRDALRDAYMDVFIKMMELDPDMSRDEAKSLAQSRRKVASDALNITCMYVIHRFMNSSMSQDKINRAMYDTALIFFYQCISALMNSYFPFPTDPLVAQQAYANLSRKNLIKQLGSWQRLMDYRANALLAKDGLHYNYLKTFDNNEKIVYAISNSQGSVKEMLKVYTDVFHTTLKSGQRISESSSTHVNAEGEETVKDKIDGVDKRLNFIKSTLVDRESFINSDFVTIIDKINKNTSRRMLVNSLNFIVDNSHNSKHSSNISKFIEKVIIYSAYIEDSKVPKSRRRDFPLILDTLKNMYLPTRSTDNDLEEIRALGYELIKASSQVRISEQLILSTRTSVILYISLRALVATAR